MIVGQNVFDQPVKNDQRRSNVWKITTGQGNNYATDCLYGIMIFSKIIMRW